jgi:hypothetical protein
MACVLLLKDTNAQNQLSFNIVQIYSVSEYLQTVKHENDLIAQKLV